MIRPFAIACTLLLTGAIPCAALIQEDGGGILYGKHPAFMVTAPKGWMFDNESGQDAGLFAVFYPKGSTWANSKVVAYAQTHPITETIKSPADLAAKTVADFKASGSPNSKFSNQPAIKPGEGKEAAVIHFSGDKWGNFEAVAYIVEDGWIHYFVLNAKTEEDFKKYRPALEELVKNYTFIGKVEIKDSTGRADAEESKKKEKEKEAPPKGAGGAKPKAAPQSKSTNK